MRCNVPSEADMTTLPAASLERVLLRAGSIWHTGQGGAPHMVIYGATGSGKGTLNKEFMARLCTAERVLIVEPKRQADPIYQGADGDPWQWGRPVREICPQFGYRGEPGGGPHGMWYRLTGSPDRADTARRFGQALEIVANEGMVCLFLDDVKETCKALGLAQHVESIMSLGRSAGICAVLSTTETSYVAGRSQGAMTWVGFTGGSIPAAKSGAELLGWRGRERQDQCGTLDRYDWIYSDGEPGSAGPVLTRTPAPAVAYEPDLARRPAFA